MSFVAIDDPSSSSSTRKRNFKNNNSTAPTTARGGGMRTAATAAATSHTSSDRFKLVFGHHYGRIVVAGIIAFLVILFLWILVTHYDITSRRSPHDNALRDAHMQKQQNDFDSFEHFSKHVHLGKQFLAKCERELEVNAFPSYSLSFKANSYCEGYWREEGGGGGGGASSSSLQLPAPLKQDKRFCGQDMFLMMLAELEGAADRHEVIALDRHHYNNENNNNNNHQPKSLSVRLERRRYRGLSTSRFESGVLLGNSEFSSTLVFSSNGDDNSGVSSSSLKLSPQEEKHLKLENEMCWTQDLRSYYVQRYNVRPSKEFVRWVAMMHGRMMMKR